MKHSVIIFIPTLITGGAEKFVTDLAVNLDKEIFDVSVATVSGIIPEGFAPNQFLSILEDNRVEVFDLKGKSKLQTMQNIRKLFRQKRPDIVHVNLGTILYVMLFAAVYDTKTRLFTFHNIPGLTAGGFRKPLYCFAFKMLHFTPVAICDFIRNAISKEYRLSIQEIPCVYNGVDKRSFSPQSSPHENRVIEFVTTGILYYIKNHRLLIDAFALAEAKHPDIRLNILGDGELRGELEQQIADYRLEEKISILGITDHVAEYLNQADIYVMSSNLEGLPIAVLEAMACGLPVITTEAGGVVDIVKTGENGFVVPVGDSGALSEAMIQLIENGELRRAMGEASRKRAVKLDLKNCVEKYQSLYINEKPDN